jgi:hypothetical protein
VFVASPGDVLEERDVVSVIVEELRRILGELRQVDLETVRWETHGWPDVGADAQDVINREIGQFDILVGVMCRRFGTPTKRGDSGTIESSTAPTNTSSSVVALGSCSTFVVLLSIPLPTLKFFSSAGLFGFERNLRKAACYFGNTRHR